MKIVNSLFIGAYNAYNEVLYVLTTMIPFPHGFC